MYFEIDNGFYNPNHKTVSFNLPQIGSIQKFKINIFMIKLTLQMLFEFITYTDTPYPKISPKSYHMIFIKDFKTLDLSTLTHD